MLTMHSHSTILHYHESAINSFIYPFLEILLRNINFNFNHSSLKGWCVDICGMWGLKIFVGMEKIFAMKVCGCVVRSWWQQNSWWQRHKSAWLRSDSRHAVTWTRHDVCLIKWCRDTWIHDTWDSGWGAVVEGYKQSKGARQDHYLLQEATKKIWTQSKNKKYFRVPKNISHSLFTWHNISLHYNIQNIVPEVPLIFVSTKTKWKKIIHPHHMMQQSKVVVQRRRKKIGR